MQAAGAKAAGERAVTRQAVVAAGDLVGRVVRVYGRLLPANSRQRWLVLWLGSSLGWSLLAVALIIAITTQGGLGYDSHAYWLAGRHVLDGQPLYVASGDLGDYGAYFYPPLFAQLAAPFALLPEGAFTWLVRLASLLSLRYLAGSWRAMGWWFLVPLFGLPAVNEIFVGGIDFPIAALTLLSVRGREGLAPWAAALHIGPIVVLPFLWLRRNRRQLLIGLLALAGACLLSAAANPQNWLDYIGRLGQQAGTSNGVGLLRLMPTALTDFAWRLALALLIVIVAVRRDVGWAAYAAHVVAAPALWPERLVSLFAVPRLVLPGAADAQSPTPAADTAGSTDKGTTASIPAVQRWREHG
jgi:hypothetical protein